MPSKHKWTLQDDLVVFLFIVSGQKNWVEQ